MTTENLCPKCQSPMRPEELLGAQLGLECKMCPLFQFVRHKMREKSALDQIFPAVKVK